MGNGIDLSCKVVAIYQLLNYFVIFPPILTDISVDE